MPDLISQPTASPSRKVAYGALGGAIGTIVIAVINRYLLPEGEMLSAEVAGAVVVLTGTAVGYFMRERKI